MRPSAHFVRRLTGVGVLACAAALASAAGFAATTSSQIPAAKATAAHLVGCNESSGIRPTNYNPICNDGAGTVILLHWSSWSGSAEGQGELYTHTCVPSCASGTVRLYSVDVSAWRVVSGDYTRFRYYFPHSVPPGFSRSWTIEYYNHRWNGKVV
jgi:hypothetical protein